MKTQEEYVQYVNKVMSDDDASKNRCVVYDVQLVDAHTVMQHAWIAFENGAIKAIGGSHQEMLSLLSSWGVEEPEPDLTQEKQTFTAFNGEVTVVNGRNNLLVPGFIDIHAHGGWQGSCDEGVQAIETVRACHLSHGTTRQVISLITNPIDVMEKNIAQAAAVASQREDVLGLHLEGPFIAPEKKGAHDIHCIIPPTPEVVEKLYEAAQGTLCQVTIAPEVSGGIEAIKQLVQYGVVAAVGHTNSTYEQAKQAFDEGASLLTHMYDAMNGISHRAPGPILAAYDSPEIICEIINDGYHVHAPAIRAAFALMDHRMALITDSMAATGCDDGLYTLGSLEVEVKDRHARLVSNGAIAGSTLTMDQALVNAVRFGVKLQDAVEAMTLTPAKAMRVNVPNARTKYPLGLLQTGYAADFVMLDEQSLEVQQVCCAGVWL